MVTTLCTPIATAYQNEECERVLGFLSLINISFLVVQICLIYTVQLIAWYDYDHLP